MSYNGVQQYPVATEFGIKHLKNNSHMKQQMTVRCVIAKWQNVLNIISNFQIPYLALRELKQLRTLDLESNNITEVTNNPEVKFTSEIDLKLSNNRITRINDDAFNSFQKFGRLDLSYNQVWSWAL